VNRSVLPFWNVVRLPALAILLMFEPIVRFVCGLGLVLGSSFPSCSNFPPQARDSSFSACWPHRWDSASRCSFTMA
jgi:hypothetical protein